MNNWALYYNRPGIPQNPGPEIEPKRKEPFSILIGVENGIYYAIDTVKGRTLIEDANAYNVFSYAINYLISNGGGRIFIRRGDYYFPPFPGNSANAVFPITIPNNVGFIIQGEGDATRLHLPQNNGSSQAWLFGFYFYSNTNYTYRVGLKDLAFVNDVNAGSYAMNVAMTDATSHGGNKSSGFFIDNVSVYDLNATPLGFTFWINNLYDVKVNRYRYYNNNTVGTAGTAFLSDSTNYVTIENSFIFANSLGEGINYAFSNGNGSMAINNTEVYGLVDSVVDFGSTDSWSSVSITNSILGAQRAGTAGIDTSFMFNTNMNLFANTGNGTVHLYVSKSVIGPPLILNFGGASSYANVVIDGVFVHGAGCPNTAINITGLNGPIDVVIKNSFLGFSYGVGSCGPWAYFSGGSGGGNWYITFENNVFYLNGDLWNAWQLSGGEILTVRKNRIVVTGMNNMSSSKSPPPTVIYYVGSLTNGKWVFEDNIFDYSSSGLPSGLPFYLFATTASSGTVSTPPFIFVRNKFKMPPNAPQFTSVYYTAGATVNTSNWLIDATNVMPGLTLPQPATSTPSMPSSGTALTNPYPYPVQVIITGGSVTNISVTRGGVSYTIYSNSSGGSVNIPIILEPGDSITITYSTAPSWVWLPLPASAAYTSY